MNARPTRRHVLAAATALVITAKASSVAAASGDTTTSAYGPQALADHIDAAARKYDVPRDILLAVAYNATRFDPWAVSQFGGHGVMQLTQNDAVDTLGQAAALTGISERKLASDIRANVLGAAAVLRAEADDIGLTKADRRSLDAWYEPVARWVQHQDDIIARLEGDSVFGVLDSGVDTADASLRIAARSIHPEISAFGDMATAIAPMSADYGPAKWVPAHWSNQTVASRPSSHRIDRVVIHTMQGYYAGSISWFQNPSSNVSAHYCLRSSDGDITQMVRHKDIGWHAGNWNSRSIGLEHEGFVDNPAWYTTAMYNASAALTRHICNTYGLAKNRTTIVGHVEVPGATHTDPGRHWDWTRYMNLVNGGSTWSVIVDNSSGFTASSNWTTGSAAGQYGSNHRHAQPVLASDPGWWRASIPSSGTYRVEVWHPADPTNNPRAPYIVATTGGNRTVHVDQTTGGGRWKSLGTFSLASGTRNVVGISRWTSSAGWIEADAIRISAV